METFIDQLWVALMSAFAVMGFVVVMACSVWLVKVIAEKCPARSHKNAKPQY